MSNLQDMMNKFNEEYLKRFNKEYTKEENDLYERLKNLHMKIDESIDCSSETSHVQLTYQEAKDVSEFFNTFLYD